MKGKFITLEGCEGSGKSTLIRSLKRYFELEGYSCFITRSPNMDSIIGNFIYDKLRYIENIPLRSEIFMYISDRIEHIENIIKPALEKYDIVLCDRFNDSTIAYQGGGKEYGIIETEKIIYDEVYIEPDLTIFLDIHPSLSLKRSKRYNNNYYDIIDFESRVYETYRILNERYKYRVKSINATNSFEYVFIDVINYLNR